MAARSKGPTLIATSDMFRSTDRRLAQNALTRANVEQINALWADAINVFVSTAVKSMLVDTSMSVSSFVSVAHSVGAGAQKIQGFANMKKRGEGRDAIPNSSKTRKGYTSLDPYKWIPNGVKGSSTGARLGRKAYTVKYANARLGVTSFEFRIVVIQHLVRMPESITDGVEAMERFVSANFDKYVNPAKALRKVLKI